MNRKYANGVNREGETKEMNKPRLNLAKVLWCFKHPIMAFIRFAPQNNKLDRFVNHHFSERQIENAYNRYIPIKLNLRSVLVWCFRHPVIACIKYAPHFKWVDKFIEGHFSEETIEKVYDCPPIVIRF